MMDGMSEASHLRQLLEKTQRELDVARADIIKAFEYLENGHDDPLAFDVLLEAMRRMGLREKQS